jgi:hypothetical protein
VIASLRGLAILAAIALVLAVVALAAAPRRTTVDHTLVGSFDLSRVTAIRLRHNGQPDIQLARKPDGRAWENAADHTPVDPATIDAMFTALRGARWQRREEARVAWPYQGDIRLESERGVLVLAEGRALATGQTWINLGASDHVLLVESWVAHALYPSPLELRVRHPFAGAATATTFTSGAVKIVGTRLLAPRTLWLDPSILDQLTSALAALEIVALPAEVPAVAMRELSYDGPQPNTLGLVGSCPGDQVLLRAATGPGCYEQATWHALDRVLTALDAASEELSDRRPLPITPATLTFGSGPTLTLGAQPRLGDTDADASRVSELMTALTTAGKLAPHPPGAPTSTLTARDAAGTEVVLELFGASRLVARRGDPVAILLPPEQWATLSRPSAALRDPIRWREDATTITSITVGPTTYTRGAVLGEWTRTSAGSGLVAADGALVDALASALATVRAPDAPGAAEPTPLTIKVTFTPPAGTPTTHELTLGPPTAGGCAAVVDGVRVRADLGLCTAAHALP